MQGNKKRRGIIISAVLCVIVVGFTLMILYGGNKDSVASDKIEVNTKQKGLVPNAINIPEEKGKEPMEEIIKSPEQLKISILNHWSGDLYIGMTRQEAINRLKQFKFKSEGLLQYFSTNKWYSPKYDNVDKFLTDTDKKNIKLVSEQL